MSMIAQLASSIVCGVQHAVKLTFCGAAMARMDDVYLLLAWLLAPMVTRLSDQDAGFNQNLGSYSHAYSLSMLLGWCYSFSVVLYTSADVLLYIGNRCMMVEFDAVCSAHGGSNCVATGPRSVGLFMSYVLGIKLKAKLTL